jgi:uncharacterized membrane protein YbhN (UPF0104 family)
VRWIALAGLLELVSILGFIACFTLVFGANMTRRQSVMAALRGLGASTVLPAGGLVGPAVGVRSADRQRAPLGPLIRSTLAFTILTTAPSVAVLAVVGVGLWLGWPAGPHRALLTLPAAAIAVGLLALVWRLGRPAAAPQRSRRVIPRSLRWVTGSAQVVREGAAEAVGLLAARNWRLLGAVVYYAFDNAVLWAAFHAYGKAPPLGVLVMGYLVGSLAAAAPIPAGLGAVEGGLIGALVVYGAPAGPAAAAVLLYRGISLGLAMFLSATAWTIKAATHRRIRAHDGAASRRRIAMGHSIMRHNSSAPVEPRALTSLPVGTQTDDAAATTPSSFEIYAGP